MRLICSQALCRSSPLCMTWIRRWSSSLIIRLNFSRVVDGHGPGALRFGVFAADQLPLDEELAVDAFQLVDVDVEQVRPTRRPAAIALVQDASRSARGPASVARLMKGKSARLRARRMRLLMTMSDSGPEPRSHSPLVLSGRRVSRSIPVLRRHHCAARSSIRRISSRSCDARS